MLFTARKNKVLKTDSCGTSLLTVEMFESKTLIDENCLLSTKYKSNHFFAVPLPP